MEAARRHPKIRIRINSLDLDGDLFFAQLARPTWIPLGTKNEIDDLILRSLQGQPAKQWPERLENRCGNML